MITTASMSSLPGQVADGGGGVAGRVSPGLGRGQQDRHGGSDRSGGAIASGTGRKATQPVLSRSPSRRKPAKRAGSVKDLGYGVSVADAERSTFQRIEAPAVNKFGEFGGQSTRQLPVMNTTEGGNDLTLDFMGNGMSGLPGMKKPDAAASTTGTSLSGDGSQGEAEVGSSSGSAGVTPGQLPANEQFKKEVCRAVLSCLLSCR